MPRVLTAQEQRLLLLAAATYSSQSTHEVAIATQEMRKFILQNFPKSFSILQQLIILKEIDINTRKSIISHIKTVSFQIKQQLHNQSQHNFEILTNNKKFLYDIEHILANNQLEGTLKQPLAEAYVNIFVLFNPQTFEKLLSKARYYFNTKQDIVGINILESYHLSIAPFKYKYEFYSKLLPLVTDYILQRIKLPQNEIADNNKQIFYLNAHLNLLAEVWTSMNFQKYESIFCKELENQKLHQIFQIFLADQVPQHLLSYLHSIASHAISGLRRIGLYRKYQKFVRIAEAHLMYVLNKEIQSQFLLSKITEDYEVRSICGKLKFLISGVDIYNEGMQLIGYNFDIYAIFTKLVYPNFKNIQRYLYNHSNNPQEIFPFLQDISFEMKSDCPEVLIHKFTCSLGKNSKLVLADIKTLIYSFLFEFLPNNSNGKLKHLRFKYNLSQSLPFWPEISTFISLKEQLLSILAFTALVVTCFLNDIEFLNDLNDFMGQNAEFFMSSDPQVQFFSLLIFRNYRADIFSNNRASIFRALIIKKLLQTGNQSLNRKFIISIFEEQLEDVPDFDDIAFNILMIVDSMAHNFDQELHYILLLIFRNYQKELNKIDSIHKITANLVNVLEQRVQQPNHIKGMENYFQMIGFLLSSLNQQCSSQLFAKSLSIIEKTQYKIQIKGEKILNIVLQMLKKSGNIPTSSEVILMSLKWQFQSIEILNSLTELIQYSQNQAFLNWIAHETTKEEFNIYSSLLLHSLTYYKSLYLTYETLELLLLKIWSFNILHSHKQNYISGKLNIVCLFLLHSQKKMVYDILLNPKWRQIQAQINNQKKLNHLFTDSSASNTTGQLSFLDQFFHMLYYHENIYRWRFDIEVFLITQLKLFQTGLQDEIQLTYANLAMVACITNTIRAYSYFQVETSHFIPETDDQEVNCCQLDIQYERHLTMMQQFNRPQQFKEDYFLLLKRWVNRLKRTQNSNKWFKTILSQMFSEQNRAIFDSILHTERCQGSKFRNVVKIQRIKGQDYQ